MPEGGTLSITAHCRDSNNLKLPTPQSVEIVVQDSGAGISPSDVGRIFDPFFSTKPEGEGTGLGLSVVHGTIKDLGGTVRVESQVGEGTKFVVRLPTTDQQPSPTIPPREIRRLPNCQIACSVGG